MSAPPPPSRPPGLRELCRFLARLPGDVAVTGEAVRGVGSALPSDVFLVSPLRKKRAQGPFRGHVLRLTSSRSPRVVASGWERVGR